MQILFSSLNYYSQSNFSSSIHYQKIAFHLFYVIFSCITEQQFTFHSYLEELLRFEFFAIVNMAAMNMDMQGSQKQLDYSGSGPRSGIAGPCGGSGSGLVS